MMRSPSDREAIRYLLGEMDADAQLRLERDYFGRDARFDELLAAEESLIEDYLDEVLAADERARFESHFLASPDRRLKVDLARQLREAAVKQPRDAPWHWRDLAVAAVLILSVGGGAWSVWRLQQADTRLQALDSERRQAAERAAALEQQATRDRQAAEDLSARLQAERAERQRLEDHLAQAPRANRILALTLRLDALRSDTDLPELALADAAEWVRLTVDVSEETSPAFSLILRNAAGNVLRQWDRIRPTAVAGTRLVSVTAPARLFSPGRYELAIAGGSTGEAETLGYAAFTVRAPQTTPR